MRIVSGLTDAAIARILGERIERYRIEAGLTQAELAERAGLGKRTLERIEAGQGAGLVTLIRVLRALEALEGFDKILPELPPSPIEQLKLRGKQRRRVSHPRNRGEASQHRDEARESAPAKPWTWGLPPKGGVPPAKGSRPARRKS
ncbi:MAG TPA: helix-turn-helix transcriptional regulator [Steroidobacteraceae bacterium]|jgi:transcriptional regulator with XRE-family HTH domain|nr:helix-turn-helix transcriptional regulator [Steroidobacteraceae bacterium]